MARSPIERCRAAGDAPAETGPGPAIAVRVHVRARRAFTTAGWRKMVARLGAAARLGFQGPPADVAARLVAFSLPTRTPTGAPCRRISASHPRASGLMHRDGPQMKNCGTGSMRTRIGIGRTYLDKDPAHVAPIDGKEDVDHRSRAVWRVRAWSRVPSVISQFSSYFAAKITSASVGYARTGELVCCLFFGSFPWTFSTAPQFATLGGRSALRAKN
jgi:hypothetical protein